MLEGERGFVHVLACQEKHSDFGRAEPFHYLRRYSWQSVLSGTVRKML